MKEDNTEALFEEMLARNFQKIVSNENYTFDYPNKTFKIQK